MQPATEFVALSGRDLEPFSKAAGRIAVADSRGNPVIAGSQNIAILDQFF